MKIAAKIRSWTIGAAAGLIIALLVLPTTRGLLLMQLSIFGMINNPLPFDAQVKVIAVRNPNDFQIQLAAAHGAYEAAGEESQKLSVLTSFENKFPNNPSAYANILRWITSDLAGNRPENYLEAGMAPIKSQYPTASSQFLAFYDSAAADGERLDPENAYFPLMRMSELFASNKDDAALAELHRAGQDTVWKEYYQDDVRGMWKVSTVQFGGGSAISRLTTSALMLFPQYESFSGATRVAVYKAMVAERSGHPASGISIRTDLMRCGALMRVQSSNLDGSMAGIGLFGRSMSNPGGVINPHEIHGRHPKNVGDLWLNDYCAYLNRTGFGYMAPAVRQEYARDAQVRLIISSGKGGDVWLQDVTKDGYYWLVDCALLISVFILVVAALVSLLALNQSVVNPLKPRAGYWINGGGMLIAAVAVILAALLVVFAAMVCSRSEITSQFEGPDGGPTTRLIMLIPMAILSPLAGIVLISLVISIKKRVPIYQGILSATSRAAFPIACLLVFTYGATCLETTKLEALVDNHNEQVLMNEGTFWAKSVGATWPGPISGANLLVKDDIKTPSR